MTAVPSPGAADRGASVLVVDDEEVVRRSYERVLKGAGYRVDSAGDGHDAVRRAHQQPFDLVLADLKMPGMDGLRMIRSLVDLQPDVRVITITGFPTRDSAAEAHSLGVRQYLTKPLSPAELLEAASTALLPVLAPAAPAAVPPGGAAVAAPELPVAWAGAQVAAEVAAEVEAQVAGFREFLKGVGMLVAAPLIGLAYVMFLPLAGFCVVASELGKTLWKLVRTRETEAR